MLPIELEIYFNTDETDNLEKMGLTSHVTNCETRLMTFFKIDAIGIAKEPDGFEYGIIYSAADNFASVLTYEELKQLLNPQQQSI
ncbi:MAG: hypothetical protein RL037_2197 [Bacteroidota bacterium]|jgi:hypothetical protein